jgi:hypothetical protein
VAANAFAAQLDVLKAVIQDLVDTEKRGCEKRKLAKKIILCGETTKSKSSRVIHDDRFFDANFANFVVLQAF